jgi:hypothetical protein
MLLRKNCSARAENGQTYNKGSAVATFVHATNHEMPLHIEEALPGSMALSAVLLERRRRHHEAHGSYANEVNGIMPLRRKGLLYLVPLVLGSSERT